MAQWRRIYLPYRRPGFNPWVKQISWKRKWLPTPVFLPGKFHAQAPRGIRQAMESQRVRHDLATKQQYNLKWCFPSGLAVKNLPAMQEMKVLSLSQEDPLEKGMAKYSSILVQRIPWTEEPGGLQFMGSQRDSWATNTFTFFVIIMATSLLFILCQALS